MKLNKHIPCALLTFLIVLLFAFPPSFENTNQTRVEQNQWTRESLNKWPTPAPTVKAAPTPKIKVTKNMSNQIARGTTGQVVPGYQDETPSNGGPFPSWNIRISQGSNVATFNQGPDGRNGWELTGAGMVTVPISAEVGSYVANWYGDPYYKPEWDMDLAHTKEFSFEVIEPVVCETGTHDDGTGTCVPDTDPQTCAAGFYHNGVECVAGEFDWTLPTCCAPGWYPDGARCRQNPVGPEIPTCIEGWHFEDGRCVPNPPEAMTATLELSFANGVLTATATGSGGEEPYWYGFLEPEAQNIQRSNTYEFTNRDKVTVVIHSNNLISGETATATAQICTSTLNGDGISLLGQSVYQDAPRFRNFYQAFVDFTKPLGSPVIPTFTSPESDVEIGAPFLGSAFQHPNKYTVNVSVEFDFEDTQTRTIEWEATDGGQCVFAGSSTFDVEHGEALPPTGCPSGTHDDGTGNCVPDVPTGPQPCADGFHDDGTGVCIPDPIDPPEPACTIDCSFRGTDKGANLYRIEAIPTDVQNPPVGASWTRDGAALASTALFVEATIEPNAEATFAVTLSDGDCQITRSHVQRNEDEPVVIEPPVDPTLAVPAAPAVARDCEAGTLIVTAPAFPENAVSLELQRDDANAIVHLFVNTDAWSDATTDEEVEVSYRCRSVNAEGGRSEWGAWSAATSRVSDALTITWMAPAADATISRPTWLRFSLADVGEIVDDCGNASLPLDACASLDVDDAQIELYLDDYLLPVVQLKRNNGSPRNGVYAFAFSPLDHSSGEKTLRVRARGSDCCFAAATLLVSVENSLHGNVFYRDVYRFDAPAGQVIGRAQVSVEVWPPVENTARNFWVQHAVRSGTELDGPYQHDDWIKHQPIVLTPGEKQTAQGTRIARQQWGVPVPFNLPHKPQIRLREKYTKQWVIATFDTDTAQVIKLREVEPGKHLVWATNPAKAFVYDGQLKPVFVGADNEAGDATDAALLGDKLFVVRPGELFAYDTDAGQTAMVYTVRGETRAPRFVERVGTRALAIYVDAAQAPATRCYDLTFATPRLVWELADAATFCAPVGTGLAVGCGAELWVSTDGIAAPSLAHTFGAAITAASSAFVGLANGEVWKRANWTRELTRPGAIGGVATWSGGTTGEAAGEWPPRGIVGGAGDWLSGQKQNGAWFDEVELTLPLDLAGKAVGGVSALELFALELPPLSGEGDAEAAKQRDERLLVGTLGGVLFVYQRSALSEKQGAIATSQTTIERVLPFPMRPAPVVVS